MKLATWNINSVRLRVPLVLQFLRDADTDVETLDTTSTDVITQDDEIEEISRKDKQIDPAANVTTQDLTTTEAQASQAKLAEGFDLSAFNDDIRAGVSKKFGTGVQAVENAQLKSDIPAFAPGDTVIVQVKVKEGEIDKVRNSVDCN